MAKAGMRRPNLEEGMRRNNDKKPHSPQNGQTPVPELQGKSKTGNAKSGNMRAGRRP